MRRRPGNAFTGPGDSPRLFARIARWYDVMNRLMSLGRDRHWRALAADTLDLPPRGRVLDVGFGTGDMALALLRRWPDAAIVGVDPTKAMMRIGRRKLGTESGSTQSPRSTRSPVTLAQADGLRLPFPDEHFDAAVSAFVLRNVVDVEQALAEQHRVVRDGGRVGCLEMSWPRTPVFGALFRFYFAELMPSITGLLSGQPAAYRYLPRSVQRFQTPEELLQTMERAGLRDVRYRKLALGTVTLHVGTPRRPRRPGTASNPDG
jgi:demethylmenaquinone methyltransferase/2-methoxy-6-polyprenyl-1,4-benzoquinol methylase